MLALILTILGALVLAGIRTAMLWEESGDD